MSRSGRWPRSRPAQEPLAIAALVLVVGVLAPLAVDQVKGVAMWWGPLVVSALVSVLAGPYGLALGVVTIPLLRRTGVGYVTPGEASGGGTARRHLAAATFYSVLTALASGVVFLTVSSAAWSTEMAPLSADGVLLAGALPVAVPVTVARAWERDTTAQRIGWWNVLPSILYGLALLPAPFTALLILSHSIPDVELWRPLASAALSL